ncbi:glycosyltransferase family 39 protein [Sporolactobacillus kofuensis]|uniref:Glycosyltransferase family 39 protein n=1 Tax=Sporolactobacillus kofuensis TaxID=269672 RepID=A0ABW1WES8_9BACL|nr:glycosyltransferase family 39 protein [Sporolactobacillus kofuensis]MCO7174947.1 glycosyltransferase family 39 protein [Sporolactobacillus kofuensis]
MKKSLITLFSIAFVACFLAVLVISFLYPLIFHHTQGLMTTALALALFAMIVLLFLISCYRWLGRFSDHVINKLSTGLFAIMLLIEGTLITVFNSIIPPAIDGGHTYAEALYLLAHGHASDSIYFKVYPNNIPITLLRYVLYRIFDLMHVTNYMIIDRSFCALILFVGIFLSWKLIRTFFDARTACLFLLIALTCLPLFFYTMYFYTDTAAIAFPVLLLYLWDLYSRSMKIRYIFLLGIALGIGDLIRPNLILFLPALVIYMFLVLNWKKTLINLAIIGILISSISLASQGVERHFGYTQDPSLSMPTLNWIMLGVSQDGGYNRHDYELTRQQPDQAAKKHAAALRIEQQVSHYGWQGLVRLWGIKTARTWGTGAHGYYWYTHLSNHPTKAYQYLFNHKNQLTLFMIQVFYIVNILLLILSVLRYFRTRKADLNLLIQICLFGNFIFYVFVWEAEPRYSMLYTPFILLGSIFGFRELVHLLSMENAEKTRVQRVGKGLRLVLTGSLLAAVFLCAQAGFTAYTQAKSPQRSYIVDQHYKVGKKGVLVDNRHAIAQTFRATGAYNRVDIGIRTVKGAGTYHITVGNLHTGKIFYSKDALISKSKKMLTLKMNHKPLVKGDEEIITISKVRGDAHSAITFNISGKGYEQRDLYSEGRLIQKGLKDQKKDLQFMVYETKNGPYLSSFAYQMLFVLPVLMLIWYGYVSLSMDRAGIDVNRRKQQQVQQASDKTVQRSSNEQMRRNN